MRTTARRVANKVVPRENSRGSGGLALSGCRIPGPAGSDHQPTAQVLSRSGGPLRRHRALPAEISPTGIVFLLATVFRDACIPIPTTSTRRELSKRLVRRGRGPGARTGTDAFPLISLTRNRPFCGSSGGRRGRRERGAGTAAVQRASGPMSWLYGSVDCKVFIV